MGFGSARALLLSAGVVILTLCPPPSLLAQATGAAVNPRRPEVSVPFIGCASSGQIETLEAPKGTSVSVPISPKDAEALAFYKSADGIGLLAPRGWYCEGASGSSGYGLFLSPKPIHRSSGGLEGPAIAVNHINGQSSGMYQIAEIVAHVFPAYRVFAKGVWEGMDLPFPSGPYPTDTLKYRGKTIVEYKTPAQTEGLGNFNSWLKKNDLPIVGAAILIVDPNLIANPRALVILSIRVPPALAPLTPAIVRYVERDAVSASRE